MCVSSYLYVKYSLILQPIECLLYCIHYFSFGIFLHTFLHENIHNILLFCLIFNVKKHYTLLCITMHYIQKLYTEWEIPRYSRIKQISALHVYNEMKKNSIVETPFLFILYIPVCTHQQTYAYKFVGVCIICDFHQRNIIDQYSNMNRNIKLFNSI